MATVHTCDFCGKPDSKGNDGIQGFVIVCTGPGEQTGARKGQETDICQACQRRLHLSVQ